MVTWAGQNIVLGYTSTGTVVVFLVSVGPRGRLLYTPLMESIPPAPVLPVAA